MRPIIARFTVIVLSLSALCVAAEVQTTVRIAQLRGVPIKWDLEANFNTFLEQANKVANEPIDIFITPECWLDGYAAPHPESTPERLRSVAQELDTSPYIQQVAAMAKARKWYICFGFTSLEEGNIYNTCGLWAPDGTLIGVYHKTHIQTHDVQFSTGHALPVWPSDFGPLGMMICADRRWPETARTLRVQGAKLILNPTYGMHGKWNETLMRVRAWENQCFIAFTHPQQSLMLDPGGEVMNRVDSDEPGVLITTIDLTKAKDDNHIQDRRPDIYGPLAAPGGAGKE